MCLDIKNNNLIVEKSMYYKKMNSSYNNRVIRGIIYV